MKWTAADAFRALAAPVHAYLRTIDRVDADDLFGDVFLAVAGKVDRFDGDEAALRRWVFTIAHHRVVDWRRHRARRQRLPLEDRDAASASDEPFDPALVAALNELTPDQREVVVLRFIADLPLEVVATITDRTVGAVKALQHRALAQLSSRLT